MVHRHYPGDRVVVERDTPARRVTIPGRAGDCYIRLACNPRGWCDALMLGIVAWINWGSLLTLIGVDSHWLVDLFDFEAIELPASLEGL